MTEQEEFEFRARLEAEAAAAANDQRPMAQRIAEDVGDAAVNPFFASGAGALGAMVLGPPLEAGYEAAVGRAEPDLDAAPRAAEAGSPGQRWASKTGYGSGPGESVRDVREHYVKEHAPIGSGKISKKVSRATPLTVQDAIERERQMALEAQARSRARTTMERLPPPVQATGRGVGAALEHTPKWARRGVAGANLGYQAADAYNRALAGDVPGAVTSGAGALGSAMFMLPGKYKKAAGAGMAVGSHLLNQAMDNARENPEGYAKGRAVKGALELIGKEPRAVQTVADPLRMAYPGIYKRPDIIAAEAAARVAPESEALRRVFGVSRGDLYEMGRGRKGNLPGALPGAAANPKGSKAAAAVMTPQNEQRLLDVMSESEKYPELVRGMDPWYVMDPMYLRMEQLLGPEAAIEEYRKMNTLMGMASPGSEVLTEIPRGTAAYYLQKQGRFPEFVEYAGKSFPTRGADFPEDIRNVPGHAYHKTAQATPMQQYLETGEMQMASPKVPMYIEASGVPQTGFQTATPVGDAHWSRAVGLADTRGAKTMKGKEVLPGASVSNPEMSMLAPWWREKIAAPLGLESVPAQARAWGAFSPQTGVTSPIGAPKLELLAQKIMETSSRMGVSPETARDMVLTGKTYAGKKAGGLATLED
jgi:hypothetical protein